MAVKKILPMPLSVARWMEDERHAGDSRWRKVGNGWQTTDPELVAEGMRRLRKSKRSVQGRAEMRYGG